MKYNVASPTFYDDVENIMSDFRTIVEGKGMLTMGNHVRSLEDEFSKYIGSDFSVATNSCTSGLEIILRAIELKADEEVIVPVQTFIATGSCVVMAGGRPVFCDTDENFLLDFDSLKSKITDKTRAVILVHFTGLIHPQVFEIKKFLNEKNILLIEDAAHAHGASINGIKAGNVGDAASFSFYSTKIMTTGEGGMITCSDDQLANACASIRDRGRDLSAKEEIFNRIGSNRRMTEFQAILGRYQLKRMDTIVAKRSLIAKQYVEMLNPLVEKGVLKFQHYPESINHAYWRFLIYLENSSFDKYVLQEKMAEKNIRIDFPYQPLLHLQPVFKQMYGIAEGHCPKAEALLKKQFCVPIHPLLKEEDVSFIAEQLLEILK